MLRRININQLREWRAFAELEPFGPRRDDARAAQTSWMLAELHRDKKKRRRPFELARASGAKVPAVMPEAKDDDDE